MRILVMGDFSGRGAGATSEVPFADRVVRPVDVDNFEDTLRRLSPSAHLTLDQAAFVTPLAQGALFDFPRG